MTSSIVRFQHKHWFDSFITKDYLRWVKEYYWKPGEMIGLIWDRAPCQANAEIDAFIETQKDWLIVACIPGGLTSIIQFGDLIANAQLKAYLKLWAAEWRCAKLRAMGWPVGHVKLKLDREELVLAMEKIIAKFNAKQRENPTIDKCFLKVGQDIFNDDLGPFNKYMETLSEITLYKTLIEAQTRADLSDQDAAAGSRRRTHA